MPAIEYEITTADHLKRHFNIELSRQITDLIDQMPALEAYVTMIGTCAGVLAAESNRTGVGTREDEAMLKLLSELFINTFFEMKNVGVGSYGPAN